MTALAVLLFIVACVVFTVGLLSLPDGVWWLVAGFVCAALSVVPLAVRR